MDSVGTPFALAGKLGGHSQLRTTIKHYTSTDAAMIQEVNERMNNFNSQIIPEQSDNDFVN